MVRREQILEATFEEKHKVGLLIVQGHLRLNSREKEETQDVNVHRARRNKKLRSSRTAGMFNVIGL